jgi:hypothetical protein
MFCACLQKSQRLFLGDRLEFWEFHPFLLNLNRRRDGGL